MSLESYTCTLSVYLLLPQPFEVFPCCSIICFYTVKVSDCSVWLLYSWIQLVFLCLLKDNRSQCCFVMYLWVRFLIPPGFKFRKMLLIPSCLVFLCLGPKTSFDYRQPRSNKYLPMIIKDIWSWREQYIESLGTNVHNIKAGHCSVQPMDPSTNWGYLTSMTIVPQYCSVNPPGQPTKPYISRTHESRTGFKDLKFLSFNFISTLRYSVLCIFLCVNWARKLKLRF